MKRITIPHHYYRGYPADFSAGKAAARGNLGWTSEALDLDLERAALLLMHLPDIGLRPENLWSPDNPRQDLLETVEWVPRAMEVVTDRLPPLVAAARRAGVQIVHITMGDSYAKDYPQRQRCKAELSNRSDVPLEPLPDDGWETEHFRRTFRMADPPHGADLSVPMFLFPPGLEPQGDDLVCFQTWELHALLQAHNLINLLYTGWALNWCLWFSPCGMNDMQRLHYHLYCVRGACVGIENAESADTEGNLEYAYYHTSAMFGYLLELEELTAALGQAFPEG
ncbi:MAG: cysteine hydrolase family protein [Armatimonadota bacterium]